MKHRDPCQSHPRQCPLGIIHWIIYKLYSINTKHKTILISGKL